jgi:hypothetical protein
MWDPHVMHKGAIQNITILAKFWPWTNNSGAIQGWDYITKQVNSHL